MACNSEKCHCPACNEERRLKGLEHRVDVLELRESNRDMMRSLDREKRIVEAHGVPLPLNNRARVVARNSRGPVYRGWGFDDDVFWQWQRSKVREDLWRRMDIKTHVTFGAPWSNRGKPVTPWGAPISYVSAVERTEHKRVGEIEQTVTDRVEFDVRNYEIGPAKIEIACNPTREVPGRFQDRWTGPEQLAKYGSRDDYFSTPKCRITFPFLRRPKEKTMTPEIIRAVMRLLETSTITPHGTTRRMFEDAVDLDLADRVESSGCPPAYRISTKGRVFAKAILALPLPVLAEPEWKMPPRS